MNKKRAQKSSSEGSGSEPEEEYDSEGSGSGVSDDLINHSPPKKAKKTEEKKEKSKTDGKKNKSVAKTKDGKNEKTKKEKDPNAPKRNQTAFFIWQQENRSKIKQPGDTVAATASRAGAMWKSMSEDEKRVSAHLYYLLERTNFVDKCCRYPHSALSFSINLSCFEKGSQFKTEIMNFIF